MNRILDNAAKLIIEDYNKLNSGVKSGISFLIAGMDSQTKVEILHTLLGSNYDDEDRIDIETLLNRYRESRSKVTDEKLAKRFDPTRRPMPLEKKVGE